MIAVIALTLTCLAPPHAHERWEMKNRPDPSLLHQAITLTTPGAILAMPVPYVTTAPLWKTWDVDQLPVVDDRERIVMRVTGFVRLAKVSRDDCDIHLELAGDAADGSPRIIVEIPQSQPDVYQAAADAFHLTHRGHQRKFHGRLTPRVNATGWLFLDVSHQSKSPTKAGHGHGSRDVRTLWELHPVFRLEVAGTDG